MKAQGQVAGARSPQAGDRHRQPAAACRLHPGAPKACRPTPLHYTWKGGAMQDLNALGPRLQLDLLRDWSCGGGLPAGASLSVLLVTSLI